MIEMEGEYQLWVAVLQDAIETLQSGNDGAGAARGFIFDPNLFFESVCVGLEVNPDVVRDQVRKMTRNSGTISPLTPSGRGLGSTFQS